MRTQQEDQQEKSEKDKNIKFKQTQLVITRIYVTEGRLRCSKGFCFTLSYNTYSHF